MRTVHCCFWSSLCSDQPVSNLLSMVDLKKINYDKLTDNRDFSSVADVNVESK